MFTSRNTFSGRRVIESSSTQRWSRCWWMTMMMMINLYPEPLCRITLQPHIYLCMINFAMLKVKQSRNRSGVAQRVPGGLGFHIFMTFGTWRWWGHQPHALAAFTPRNFFFVLIFTRGWVDPSAMVRSEGICHWKIQWHHRESIPSPSD